MRVVALTRSPTRGDGGATRADEEPLGGDALIVISDEELLGGRDDIYRESP